MKRKPWVGAMLATCAVLAGCAGDGSMQAGSTAASAPLVPSGFLSDYGKLKPVDGVEGAYRYVDTSVRLRLYEKVMIDPVRLIIAPGADASHASPEMMRWIADAVRMEYVGALLSDYEVDVGERWGYQIVNAPGPDVIRVRLAITGIHPVRPNLTATDFIPIKAVFDVARDAAGEAPRVAELTAEVEVLDPSGRMVAEAVATRKSDMTLPQGADISWKDLKGIAATWARGFRQQLDELRAYSVK